MEDTKITTTCDLVDPPSSREDRGYRFVDLLPSPVEGIQGVCRS